MSADPLVSVIVPIYNVEDYLEECVRSIIAQSYRKLEIVLVDDGSEDRSGLICDELAAIDDRVVAYHKENGGLSDARNYGLAKSHGEWISFIDSDDYISPVFIEALLRAAINAGCDISAIPFGKPFSDADRCELLTSLPTIPIETLDSHSTQRLMLYQALDTGAPWRLYRKIFILLIPSSLTTGAVLVRVFSSTTMLNAMLPSGVFTIFLFFSHEVQNTMMVINNKNVSLIIIQFQRDHYRSNQPD